MGQLNIKKRKVHVRLYVPLRTDCHQNCQLTQHPLLGVSVILLRNFAVLSLGIEAWQGSR